MNRWLTRKKDGADKKGKKGLEEAKPEFNLNAVLPQVDDFRTSLIMPGLSTRFSMLREQDDPHSKLGKASDDSVLQPKRQSRLHDFGFVPGGLSDIAEVSSINGSIRPPFANERSHSFDSTRDDDSPGSIMSRSRPGEGNVLFGGRQKIYMISNNSTKGLGRTLYDDDVNMSAYQRLRREEREKLRLQTEDMYDQSSEPPSPASSGLKREASTSSTSTPVTRTSTAATSIASQGASSITTTSPVTSVFPGRSASPELGRSKPRRLYDQGLDQQIHEQQSSALHRLNTIQKSRTPTGRSTPPIILPQVRSATNLNDRFPRSPALRSDSPNYFGYPGMNRNNSSASSSPVLSRPLSPPLVSPVLSEGEEAQTLNAALEPNDRGKATALGAFNKPKEAFSEEQYAERLRQMQKEAVERKSPALVPAPVPASAPSPPPKEEKSSPPRKMTLRERAELEKEKRKRVELEAEVEAPQQVISGTPKVVESTESLEPEPQAEASPALAAFSRFQAAVGQMKKAGPAAPTSPQKQSPSPPQTAISTKSQRGRTFVTSADSSDADEDVPKPASRRFENLPVATGPAPSLFDHPALRSRSTSNEKLVPSSLDTLSPRIPQGGLSPKPDDSEVDSPTLGPDNGGLSGLIRQHLRNVSTVSSNYDAPDRSSVSPPAGLMIQTHDFRQRQQSGSESVTPAPSTYSQSNPWDLDDIDNPNRDKRSSLSSVSPIDPSKITPLIMSATLPNGNAPWDLTPRRNHERVASNETEAEHEAFQRDLAQKQRLIQENLRVRAEGRSTSPAAPGASGSLKNALSMLRAKSSRESFAVVDRPESSAKSLRKLTPNVSSTSLAALHETDAQRQLGSRQRSGTESSRTGRTAGRTGHITPRSTTRDRSGSGTSSGRSRSRPRTEVAREDFAQIGSSTPPMPAESRPSEDNQSRIRSRSNSRAALSHYFDSKLLQPGQLGTQSASTSPRIPFPQSKVPTGAPISPRPSPGEFSPHGSQPTSPMPPFAGTHTPPMSNPGTPNAAMFPGATNPMIRQGMLRKKSVAKMDISEPVFISGTSNIDLVDLPPGASMKNGADELAPPVPPINPMRRRFGFSPRGESSSPPHDSSPPADLDVPRAPYAEPVRHNSSDAGVSKSQIPRAKLRKTSSEGKSLRGTAQVQGMTSPPMPHTGFVNRNNSPPRPINDRPMVQRPMNGAMF